MTSVKPRTASGAVNVAALLQETFLTNVAASREAQDYVQNFAFQESRYKVLSKASEVSPKSHGILYWMSRECRVEDNWSMIYAQRLAILNNIPLFLCFNLFEGHHLYPTRRQQKFLLKGLDEIDKDLNELKIKNYLINASPEDLANIVKVNKIGAVVCDFNPLRKPIEWQERFLKKLPDNVPLFQVDSRNIVPVWTTSNKQEHMARTIRPKINNQLPEFLTGFPKISKNTFPDKKLHIESQFLMKNYEQALEDLKTLWDVEEVDSIEPGPKAALKMLHSFLTERLKLYGIKSNDPSQNATSNLSYWIHFGHISAQRIALEVKDLNKNYKEQVEKYLEELIVRKELTDNFCYFNKDYDNLNGAADWAKKTLKDHSKDKRVYVYTREQLSNGETHDELWNAAQLQMLKEAKIHGYMRMYWCKKILEWTESPEQALEYALWINDIYGLDGSDPNGFVGVMWSICGVHDQGWREREVFGKIRYMVDYSLRKKFDMDAYCARYGIKGKNDERKKKKATKRKAS